MAASINSLFVLHALSSLPEDGLFYDSPPENILGDIKLFGMFMTVSAFMGMTMEAYDRCVLVDKKKQECIFAQS
jgi:hypothetical protein